MKLKAGIIATLTTLIMLLGWLQLPSIPIDNSLDQFEDKPQKKQTTQEDKSQKEKDNTLILCLSQATPFSSNVDFQEVDSLVTQLQHIKSIKKISWIGNFILPVRKGPFLIRKNFLPINDPELFKAKWKKVATYKDITLRFLSKDHKSIALYLQFKKIKPSQKDVSQIQHILKKQQHFKGQIIGSEILANELANQLKSDTLYLVFLGLLFIFCCFQLVFRSFRDLLFVLWLISTSTGILYLVISLSHIKLNTFTVSVPLFVTIFALSDAIHILHHFKSSKHNSFTEKTKSIFSKIGISLFLTSFTATIGFLVFLLPNQEGLNQLVFFTVLGIVIAFSCARLISPYYLFIMKIKPYKRNFKTWKRFIFKSLNWLFSYQYKVQFILIATLILGTWYSFSSLKINQHNISHSANASDVEKALAFYDKQFTGTRSIEIDITYASGVWTTKRLKQLERIEAYLTKEYGTQNNYSLVTIIKRNERFMHGGQMEFYKIPKEIDPIMSRNLYQYAKTYGFTSIISEDLKHTKIQSNIQDIGSGNNLEKTKELEGFLKQLNTKNIHFKVTGRSLKVDRFIHYNTNWIIYGILSSIFLLSCIIGVYFRSIRMALISLIPNIIPLVFVLFLFSILNIDINPTNVMMLSIVFGITVDDTIYSLMHIQQECSPILLSKKKMIMVVAQVSFPLMCTSLLLISGFAAFYFSAVQSNIDNSVFFVIALFIALLSDLFLLPLFLINRKNRSFLGRKIVN